jgi:hypothetical protein
MPSGSRFDKVGLKQTTKIQAPTYHIGRLALVVYANVYLLLIYYNMAVPDYSINLIGK